MANEASRDKDKFLFDLNIFDEREEPDEPPPPMFSEGELADAQKKSFNEGKNAGLQESAASREQEIAKIIGEIEKNVASLFQAEVAREKAYETEVVKLCLAIFQKTFPVYQEKFGLLELQNTLENILRRQEGQKQVQIHVAPDAVEGVKTQLLKMKQKNPDLNFSVLGDEMLTGGNCRLSWADGGAVRNAEVLAQEIEGALKELLAATATKVHDG